MGENRDKRIKGASTLAELIDSSYPDRGGYKKLKQIFDGSLLYEQKLRDVQETFIKSRSTAALWYTRYMKDKVK